MMYGCRARLGTSVIKARVWAAPAGYWLVEAPVLVNIGKEQARQSAMTKTDGSTGLPWTMGGVWARDGRWRGDGWALSGCR
jgi:hypothetical protein